MDNRRQRLTIFDEMPGPNENRFLNLNVMPAILSKYTTVDAPDFKRYVIRDINKQPKKNQRDHQPDYNPNVEYTMKSLALGITPFEKQMDREMIDKLSRNQNSNSPSFYTYADSNQRYFY